jgi:hypothetical protein
LRLRFARQVVDVVEEVMHYEDSQYVAFDSGAANYSSGIIKTGTGEMIAVVDLVNCLGPDDLKLMKLANPSLASGSTAALPKS